MKSIDSFARLLRLQCRECAHAHWAGLGAALTVSLSLALGACGGSSTSTSAEPDPQTLAIHKAVVTQGWATAKPDQYTVAGVGTTTIAAADGVLANDELRFQDGWKARLLNPPKVGQLDLAADGSLTWVSPAGFRGTVYFTYRAERGDAISSTVSVALTSDGQGVSTKSDGSVQAQAEAYDTPAGRQLLVYTADGVLKNDGGRVADGWTAQLSRTTAHGIFVLNADGSFGYIPTPGFTGVDQFVYSARDAAGRSSQPITVPIYVGVPNAGVGGASAGSSTGSATTGAATSNGSSTTAASGSSSATSQASSSTTLAGAVTSHANGVVANDDAYQGTPGGQLLIYGAQGVLNNDGGTVANGWSATLVTAPARGLFAFNPDGSFGYIPEAGFTGVDEFTYYARNAAGVASANKTVRLYIGVPIPPPTVTIVDEPAPNPTALDVTAAAISTPDLYSTPAGRQLLIYSHQGVLANDGGSASTGWSVRLVTAPAIGQFVLNADGSFGYIPPPNYNGVAEFVYVARNAAGTESGPTSARIQVGTATVTTGNPLFNPNEGPPTSTTQGSCASGSGLDAIHYCLNSSGRVSMIVTTDSGRILRTVAAGSARSAGAQFEAFDAKTDDGGLLPDGTYKWKLLKHKGFQVKYLSTLGSSFGHGQQLWEGPPGVHRGPTAVHVDATGMYVSTGISEATPATIKQTLSGQRIWSAYSPKDWAGGYALATMNGVQYMLTQDQYLMVTNADAPNMQRYASVGGPGNAAGQRWDVLGPNESRSENMNIFPRHIDMTAGVGQVVVAYRDQNLLRWYQPLTYPVQTIAGLYQPEVVTPTIVDELTVPSPQSVAIAPDGSVLFISGDKLYKVSRTQRTPVEVISSGLTAPYRVAVEHSSLPSHGEILIAEREPNHQVKRFTPAGQRIVTYGRMGGRRYGLYQPTDFLNIADIASDNEGGFVVAEANVSPRRVARFDRNGRLVKEWHGGMNWNPSVAVDPDNPNVVWMEHETGELIRVIADYNTGNYQIHSVFKFHGLASGMIKGTQFGDSLSLEPDWHVWSVRRLNGRTYLVRDNQLQVLRVDEVNWRLVPVVVGSFGTYDATTQTMVPNSAFLWTDANGDGIPQESEYRRYPGFVKYPYETAHLRAAPDMTYYYRGESLSGNKIYRLPISGVNAVGAPIFDDLPNPHEFSTADLAYGASLTDATSMTIAADGSVYVADQREVTWGTKTNNKIRKFYWNGQLAWSAGTQAFGANVTSRRGLRPATGTMSAIKHMMRTVVHNVVIAQDYGGTLEGEFPLLTYAYDTDGLWVGGLFDNPDLTAAPAYMYSLFDDNGTGDVFQDPATGGVLYLGGNINDVRVYKITGWDTMRRQQGTVTIAGGRVVSSTVTSRQAD